MRGAERGSGSAFGGIALTGWPIAWRLKASNTTVQGRCRSIPATLSSARGLGSSYNETFNQVR